MTATPDTTGSLPLLVLAGPTATGKTEMAMQVAQAVGGEIISGDAFQIYRRMAVGTAQPTAEQRGQVPFHLVDEIEPDQPFTVADFQQRAHQAITDIWSRGHLPILCGGTGLYLRVLLRHFNLPPPPELADEDLRQRLHQEASEQGLEALYARLQAIDPVAAERISPQDERRLVRGLEIWELTGKGPSEVTSVDQAPPVRYNSLCYVLTCPRDLLYGRIDERIDRMLQAGWLEEVRSLREAGFSPQQQALRALGYGHLFAVLAGHSTVEQAAEEIKRETHRFAKRQLTWFRREYGFTWMTWSTDQDYRLFTEHLCQVAGELMSVVPA